MSFVELYDDDILDTINLGQFASNFNEFGGDYIKVQIMKPESDIILGNFYSNRLLFKYPSIDEYYFGDYHFHPENQSMGFCSKKNHEDNSITNLKPITIDNTEDEPLNSETKYKKHFNIFKDDINRIYIKPNEIIKFLKLDDGKYKIRIYFLKNIKSTLGEFLGSNKNNLIENGNFFAGLEATQTGDLDRSTGRNNFVIKDSPSFGKFVLEQDGLGDNKYNMRVTGTKPSSYYVFSCWVAWSGGYDGSKNMVYFNNASTILNEGLPTQTNTDLTGSWLEDGSKIISTKVISGLSWQKIFVKVYTNQHADLGTIDINLGTRMSDKQPTSIYNRRYFTDLRFEKLENFEVTLSTYFNKLKIESK